MAKPAIKSPADIKGKLVSVGGPKDITRIYVEQTLDRLDVKPGDDDLAYAGATSAFAALSSGGVMPRSSRHRSVSQPPRQVSIISATSTTMSICRLPALPAT